MEDPYDHDYYMGLIIFIRMYACQAVECTSLNYGSQLFNVLYERILNAALHQSNLFLQVWYTKCLWMKDNPK